MSMKIDGPAFRDRGRPDPSRDDAMKLRVCGLLAIAAFALVGVLGSAQSPAQNAYITNAVSDNVSVIETATNKVTATIPLVAPHSTAYGVAVTPAMVYVGDSSSGSLSVIDAATNTLTTTIPVNSQVFGVAVSPDRSRVYAAFFNGPTETAGVAVIDTASNAVIGSIPVALGAFGVAVSPDGSRVYVATGSPPGVGDRP
jgi:YVTN family beta-propeller protein